MKTELLDTIQKIRNLDSLKPNPKVNNLFDQLVSITFSEDNDSISNDKEIERLLPIMQGICSKAESLLEEYWARKILASKSIDTLLQFPYYDQYVKLANAELLNTKGRKNILFVGSGPLPLSAILLAKEHQVTCLEKEKKAYGLSFKLVEKLNLSNKIKIINKDALSFDDIKDFEVIIIAALAGNSSEEKKEIIEHLSKNVKKGTIFLIRSANGLKRLLYPKVSLEQHRNLSKHKEIKPNGVINSVIIAEAI